MPSSDFINRRARQMTSVAVNGPLVVAARPEQIYGVARALNNSVIFQFGDVRFTLERDDAIRLAMLTLKYAGVEVDCGDQEQVEQGNVNVQPDAGTVEPSSA